MDNKTAKTGISQIQFLQERRRPVLKYFAKRHWFDLNIFYCFNIYMYKQKGRATGSSNIVTALPNYENKIKSNNTDG